MLLHIQIITEGLVSNRTMLRDASNTPSSQQLPSSSSGAEHRAQHMYPSSTTTTTNTTLGQQQQSMHSRVHAEGHDTVHQADYDEHWASPSEVLQIRALWDTTKTRHLAEIKELKARVAHVEKERDDLLMEVRETERLREQYRAARSVSDSVRQEKNQWLEEREMLMLRLQRMANEIDRLREHHHRGGQVGGSSSSGSQPPSTGTVGSFGTVGSSLWSTNMPFVAMTSAEETVRLLEQLHREALMTTAWEQRFDLQSVVTAFEIARLHRQRLVMAAENEMLRNKVRLSSDAEEHVRRSLRYAQQETLNQRSEVEQLERQLKQLEDKRALDLADAERQWETLWQDDVLGKEQAWRTKEVSLQAQIAELEEEKSQWVLKREELVRSRENLEGRHQEEVAGFESELAAAVAELASARGKLRDADQLKVQQASLSSQEIRSLVSARDEAVRKHDFVAGKLSDAERDMHEARLHIERQGIETVKLRKKCEELTRAVDAASIAEGERDTYRLRATQLEEEIAVQREFYEKQQRVLHDAFGTLQRQKRSEADTMLKEMVQLRRCTASKSSKRRDTKKSGDDVGANKQRPSEPAPNGESPTTPLPTPGVDNKLDALAILKNTKALADRLQNAVCQDQ